MPKQSIPNNICSIEGCSSTVHCKGWCSKHYQRFKTYGTSELPDKPFKTCSEEGCAEKVYCHGRCATHYRKWYYLKRSALPPTDKGECSVDGCRNPVRSNELCHLHYHRAWVHGSPTATVRRHKYAGMKCKIDSCNRAARSRDLCSFHYQRSRRGTGIDSPKRREIGAPLSREELESLVIPVTESGCWLWEGIVHSSGYALVTSDGEQKRAHRFAYETFIGDIPDGMHVLHKCDVRCCVNPNHLFVGTNLDNIRDRVKKGRSYKGRLTDAKVIEIKDALRNSRWRGQQKWLAMTYGVSVSTIRGIHSGKHWTHI